MDAFANARDEGIPDALALAWQRATEAWSEAGRHDEVMRLVSQHDAYAWAAGRYREAARERPGDAMTERQLERVRRAAEATLLATGIARDARTPAPYRMTTVVLALLVIVAIAGFIYAMARRGGGAPLTPPSSQTPANEVR